MFYLQQSRYLWFSVVQESCHDFKELDQGGFYSFDLEKAPFILICLLPTHK